jgi:hypothetical protein
MISTRDLSSLPGVDRLRAVLQSMAMLDAILCPEWQFRYYSFNARWSPGEQLGSMRNGSGDDFIAVFNAAGCWLKGFAHEAPLSPYRDDGTRRVWQGVLDQVPEEFAACLSEPAFNVADATFCIWRRHGDASWRRGRIGFPPDHSAPTARRTCCRRSMAIRKLIAPGPRSITSGTWTRRRCDTSIDFKR